MPEGIQVHGPHQFRVQVRGNGLYQTKTFERLSEAQEWQRVMEGKVTGEEPVDLKRDPQHDARASLRLDARRQARRERPRRQERLREAPPLEGQQVRDLVTRLDPRLGSDRMAAGSPWQRQAATAAA
jgi:hypothetical protein